MQFPATLGQLAEKPPPPAAKQGKILRLDLTISCNFQQHWFSWQKIPPTSGQTGKDFETGYIHFMQFPATLVQLAENPPSFLPFCERPSSHHTCRIPMALILQIHHSDSSYPNIFFRLPTLSTFQNTHIYRSTGHRIMVQVEGP